MGMKDLIRWSPESAMVRLAGPMEAVGGLHDQLYSKLFQS